MKRFRLERQIACQFSEAIDYAEDYFRERTPALLRLPARLGPMQIELKRAVTLGLVIHPDWTDPARKHDALQVWMRPLGWWPFPELQATLTVRPFLPPGTLVVLDIAYEPPLGIAGRLIDRCAAHYAATALGRALLDDVCGYLTARSREGKREDEGRPSGAA